MNRLKEKFNKEIRPALQKSLAVSNVNAVPQIKKVVVNVGLSHSKADKNKKYVDDVVSDLKTITGQAPVLTKARKSVSGFKIRENEIIGVMVTLRGTRMYEFLDKLVNAAMPRIRDFRGISPKSFDGRGNYHIGMREQLVFPEISEDSIEHTFGMEISIVTNAGTDAKAHALLKSLGFPFSE